ncbi:tetratricopeptide repeat protein [Promethearchaeum syntrophicum]|uniref:Tetratricopeptide repeat protein n=1 Tax=Promethearchaeum syntrophicum TaxID=2594042 RepID=A0A5B9DFI0_9ARCH|nr:tetratricopeptide repeat protein [Candidatus Prometheoarchaeum syntrophicum]QEE17550.1 photosystem I assembly protein Ycf3 [Candidatus Prometheoarchaeum syntrophicum]
MIFTKNDKTLNDLFEKGMMYTFLVGAGISMNPPSNLPSAKSIIRVLLESCIPSEELTKSQSIKGLRYEMIIEQVQNRFDNELKMLDYFEKFTHPNLIHLFLAYAILKANYVITTNFDYLIEFALKKIISTEKHKDIIPIITREDFTKYIDLSQIIQSSRYPLIKIHGSKYNIITGAKTSDSVITTMKALGSNKEEGKTFDIEPFKKPLIEKIFIDRTLVVIGYSGSDDFDIAPMLSHIKSLKRLIWIEHSMDNAITVEKVSDILGKKSESDFTPLDLTLFNLGKKTKGEVYRIKTNTQKFIKDALWKFILEDILVDSVKIDEIGEKSEFKDFFQSLQLKIKEVDKYKFVCNIYSNFNMYEEVVQCAKKGINLSHRQEKFQEEMYFYNYLGLSYKRWGKKEESTAFYKKGLEIAEKFKNLSMQMTFYINLGSIVRSKGEFDKAIGLYDKAINTAIILKDYEVIIGGLVNKGEILLIQGKLDAALVIYDKLLKSESKIGDLNVKSTILGNLGLIYVNKGDIQKGTQLILESIKIDKALDNQSGVISKLNNLASFYHNRGDLDNALKIYYQSFQIANDLQFPTEKAQISMNIAIIFLDLGDLDKALTLCLDAQRIFLNLNDQKGIADAESNIGMIKRLKNDFVPALDILNSSLQKYRVLKIPSKIAHNQFNIGVIYQKTAKWKKALECYEESLKILEEEGDIFKQGHIHLEMGSIYRVLKEPQKAYLQYDHAEKKFLKVGNQTLQIRAKNEKESLGI